MKENVNDSIDQGRTLNGSYTIKDSLIEQPKSEKQIEIPENLKNSKLYQSEKVQNEIPEETKRESKEIQSPNTKVHVKTQRDSKENQLNFEKLDQETLKDDLLIYDSKTPSEIIYRNISDLTMNQKEFLKNHPNFIHHRETSDLLKSEVNNCDAVKKFFKKNEASINEKTIEEAEEDKWSNKAYKQKPMAKIDLMQKMRQSLKSAEEYSRKSILGESFKEESVDLLSEFSRKSDSPNKHEQLSMKRKTTFNGLAKKSLDSK
jgi:hypothetical protein